MLLASRVGTVYVPKRVYVILPLSSLSAICAKVWVVLARQSKVYSVSICVYSLPG